MQVKHPEKIWLPAVCICLVAIALIFAYIRQKELAFYQSVLAANGNSASGEDAAENKPDAYGLYQKMNESIQGVSNVAVQSFFEVKVGPEYGEAAGVTYGTFDIKQIRRSDADIDMEMDGNIRFENGVREMLNYYSSGEYTFKDKSGNERMGMPMDVSAIPLLPVNPQFSEPHVISSFVENTPEGTKLIFYLSGAEIGDDMRRIHKGTLIGIGALDFLDNAKFDCENIKYEVYLDDNYKPLKCSITYETMMLHRLDSEDAAIKAYCCVRIDEIQFGTFDIISFPYEVGANDPAIKQNVSVNVFQNIFDYGIKL